MPGTRTNEPVPQATGTRSVLTTADDFVGSDRPTKLESGSDRSNPALGPLEAN